MPRFRRLTRAQERSFERFELARDRALRFELSRLAARTRIRIALAISSRLDPERPAQARLLATFARRAASGYDRLEHLGGAIRFTRRLADVAARRAGLAPGSTP